jgi:hypothetical protein
LHSARAAATTSGFLVKTGQRRASLDIREAIEGKAAIRIAEGAGPVDISAIPKFRVPAQ